ncbi:MAG TPA: DNA-binding protein [Micromonosporaceae bacterium]|nr:DNA-binding protein [Micromonosporaceae bacterium]
MSNADHTTTPTTATSADHGDRPAAWTADRIRALGAVTNLRTAADIFGLSRAVAYDLAKRDQFPVPVLRVGGRYRVPVAPILTVLHVPGESAAPTT